MALIDLLNPGDVSPDYYDPDFRRVLSEHIAYLTRTQAPAQIVDGATAIKYTGDFFGLLTALSVPKYTHWAALCLNGIVNPTDIDSTFTSVRIPDPQAVRKVFQTWRVQNRKK